MSQLSKKQITFLFWLITSSIILFIVFLIIKLFTNPKEEAPLIQTEIVAALQEKADKAHEEMLIERTKTKFEAEEAQKHLDEVLKIDDGVERRKKLAALLNQ